MPEIKVVQTEEGVILIENKNKLAVYKTKLPLAGELNDEEKQFLNTELKNISSRSILEKTKSFFGKSDEVIISQKWDAVIKQVIEMVAKRKAHDEVEANRDLVGTENDETEKFIDKVAEWFETYDQEFPSKK